jgi:hypothetical protein
MANTLTTFNGLLTGVPIWTRRNDTDFIAQVPNFINLTQQAIFIDCPTMVSQYYVTGNFTPNNNIVSVPSLWGSNLTFSYVDPTTNKIIVLEYAPLEFIQMFNPTVGGLSPNNVLPRYYSNYGLDYLIVAPTPTAANPFLLAFDTNSTPLNASTQTNIITQQLYDLLFFGTMSLAYAFLENETQFQKYNGLYQGRVQAYQAYNTGRKMDRAANAEKD